uniref:Reverse transcriptase domain-containing protein n=1 Tax=Cannabis sativa TaxID=3483 RepID=A0A803QDU6_CANSA
MVVCDESFKVRDGNHRTKGAWKRRSGGQSELKIGKSAPVEDAATDSGCFEVRPAGIVQDGTIHGVTSTMQDDEANATTHTVVSTEGIRKENVSLPPIPNVPGSILKIPRKNILLELPNPDFAFPSGPNDGWDLIPDFGPSLVQSLEIRHIWSCKSQRPHDFPEPISLRWPSNDPKLQKVYCVLLGPDIVDLYKAQPSLISNPPNIFELIVHLLGNRKRKAHTCNGVEGTHMESAKFQSRSCDGCETSRRQGRRGRPRGVSSSSHGKSGVKTRRRKRAKEDEIKGNIKGILAQCVDAAITFISNFGDGEEREPYEASLEEKDWICGLLRWAFASRLCQLLVRGLGICFVFTALRGRWFGSHEGDLLSNFQLDIGGVDLEFISPNFTWYNARDAQNRIKKRLDRAIASSDWGFVDTNREDIGRYFVEKFKTLLESSSPAIGNDLESLFDAKVTSDDNSELCRVPTGSEIKDVIWNLHPLKALGPDGFSGVFFRTYWDVVGRDICNMVQHFFVNANFVMEMNHTLICLIPKCESPTNFDQFRPISLYNFGYKILARLLTNRLKPILDKLITLDTMKKTRGKSGFMAVKTNMHKAYDRIEWSFLLRVLKANRFNEHACSLIMQSVTTVSFSVLLNGAPLKPFSPRRGLRQGDPLSPYLFILCSEVLSKLLCREEDRCEITGIKIGKNAMPISHLFYADDAIIFCKANEKEAAKLLNCLENYECWSDQKVSKAKSGIIFSPKVRLDKKESIMATMGMKTLSQKENTWAAPSLFMPTNMIVLGSKFFLQNIAIRWISGMWRKTTEIPLYGRAFWMQGTSVAGAGFLIGNGGIDIWTKPWVPGLSLEEVKQSFTHKITHSFTYVADLFLPGTRRWNEPLIYRCFSPEVAKAIVPIRPLDEAGDTLFWKVSRKGLFTVKNVYWFSQQLRLDPMDVAIMAQSFRVVNSVLETELEAVHLCLEVALEEKLVDVLVESDSMIVVNALNSKELPYAWGSYPIFIKCITLIRCFNFISFKFIPRSENSDADMVAFALLVIDDDVPCTYREAVQSVDDKKWKLAMMKR